MPDYILVTALVQNIRANLYNMSKILTPFEDRDSQLIDFINHMDSLLQQIEYELDDSDV